MDATRSDLLNDRARLICCVCDQSMTANELRPLTIMTCPCGVLFALPPERHFFRHTRRNED